MCVCIVSSLSTLLFCHRFLFLVVSTRDTCVMERAPPCRTTIELVLVLRLLETLPKVSGAGKRG